jgi:hypothetical protein
MPSLREISTSRSAQETKAPMAQMVMICHSRPLERRKAQAVAQVRRRDVDLPEVPGRPDAAPQMMSSGPEVAWRRRPS